MEKIIKIFKNKEIFAEKKEKRYLFGFGKEKEDKIILNPYEAFYIIKKKGGILAYNGKILKDLLEISEELGIDLIKFRVFEDLRDKGYKIKIFEDYIIVPEKEGNIDRFLCIPFFERDKIKKGKLLRLIDLAKKLKLELLIAVVDIEGDVTYYKIKEIRIK